jgi:murein DD-endopeptidase MepM/ murein hydrolase activator NlpD
MAPACILMSASMAVAAPSASPQPSTASIELSSPEVPDGSLIRMTLHLPVSSSTAKPIARFEEEEAPFYPMPELGEGAFEALVAVPHNHKPGDAEIRVKIAEQPDQVVAFRIVDAHYPSETLKVNERKVNPRKKDMIRISKEQAELNAIYHDVHFEKQWKGPFVLPIDSKITSNYGTKRLYNGQLKNFHNGLDLKAAIGTPIYAAAPGIVVMAKNLFFTGNTVLVDHGYGIVTIYAHMSKLKVKKGQKVETHQLLGLAGNTGRVTGPHLHWSASINRVKINPLDLTKVVR